jgi:hypothetical protein
MPVYSRRVVPFLTCNTVLDENEVMVQEVPGANGTLDGMSRVSEERFALVTAYRNPES